MNGKFALLAALTATILVSASAVVVAQSNPPLTEQEFARVFANMDTDGDGRISHTEYANYHSSQFDTWDTALSGTITREQIRASMFEREMARSDGNAQGNSSLSGAEQKK